MRRRLGDPWQPGCRCTQRAVTRSPGPGARLSLFLLRPVAGFPPDMRPKIIEIIVHILNNFRNSFRLEFEIQTPWKMSGTFNQGQGVNEQWKKGESGNVQNQWQKGPSGSKQTQWKPGKSGNTQASWKPGVSGNTPNTQA